MSDGFEKPHAADLLAIARTTLLADILPQLAGDARFKALMIANAIAIAARETAATEPPTTDLPALCQEIRAGLHDPGQPTHQAVAALLTTLTTQRCRVSAPKALSG